MAWNFDRSKDRLQREWKRITDAGVTVKPLTREMGFSNLSPTDTRIVTGVHVYADISNLHAVLCDPLQRRDDYRRVYRTLHLTRIELQRIFQNVFSGDKIQVQGGKFHGLIFRPYNNPSAMAYDAVLAGLAINSALTTSFAEVFPSYPSLIPAIGLDLGDCLVANIGARGDRELISIGNAANNAAKILTPGTLTIGQSLFNRLSEEVQGWFTRNENSYELDPSDIDDLEALIKDAGYTWSTKSSTNNLQNKRDGLPLADIAIEDAREKIDLTRLGPRCAKTVPAASLFVDIDGYTSLVDSLNQNTDDLVKAVQVLHLFRYELRHVCQNDFDGIALQHQGDRLQALLHAPHDDDGDVKQAAIDLCIAANSSVELVINEYHDILGKLHVAIGCAFGNSLVGKLGVKGDMDYLCIGDATSTAERLQLAMPGNHLGITRDVHSAITDDAIIECFTWNRATTCYEATNLTFEDLEEAEDAKAYKTAAAAGYTSIGAILIAPRTSDYVPLKVTRPYAE
ncbi:MAG: hypothetical protein IPP47_17530 [Bryobacterales bacterium]|nr:hypothetical protein [Bryobacterales bacterium]